MITCRRALAALAVGSLVFPLFAAGSSPGRPVAVESSPIATGRPA
ncbi:hypothetical protein [Streptomyces sp. NPDC051162]